MLEIFFITALNRLVQDVSKVCAGKTKEMCREQVLDAVVDRLYEMATKRPKVVPMRLPSNWYFEDIVKKMGDDWARSRFAHENSIWKWGDESPFQIAQRILRPPYEISDGFENF